MTATYDGKNTIIIYARKSVRQRWWPTAKGYIAHIGGWTANASELLNGMLYDVAIFNIALTQER